MNKKQFSFITLCFCFLFVCQMNANEQPNYFPESNIKRSVSIKKQNKKTFVSLTSVNCGMFRILASVFGAIALYEDGQYCGVSVDFGRDGVMGPYYDKNRGENWWNYYFEPLLIGKKKHAQELVTANGPIGHDFALLTEFNLPRKRVHSIIEKYIRIRPHIQKIVNDIVSSNFSNYVIGVHYRGTDKTEKGGEAPRANYEDIIVHINDAITNAQNENFKIFIATDEQAFLDFMNESYPGKIICYEPAIRSSNDLCVHLIPDENNYKKGEDALVDCLLLSHCNILLKTSSNLSLFSSYFNPDIPVVHMTKRTWIDPLE
jgi:hypothetical protein